MDQDLSFLVVKQKPADNYKKKDQAQDHEDSLDQENGDQDRGNGENCKQMEFSLVSRVIIQNGVIL